MNILALDTSADETSAAVTDGFRVIASTIASQAEAHRVWGGIVPSIAKLAHAERIDGVVAETLRKARISVSRQSSVDSHQSNVSDKHLFCADDGVLPRGTAQAKHGVEDTQDINAIAVTYGPGLSIALEVGIRKAKQLATEWSVPLIAVNHMEGHLYSPYVQNSRGNPRRDVVFPFLALLVSGGHTQIILARENGVYEVLGETQDDAAGEALDKAAKMIGLGYPGGPIIERLAQEAGHVDPYRFPRPMMRDPTCDMSFSGLKTHLHYFLKGEKGVSVDLRKDVRTVASSFQSAVFDCLITKFSMAYETTRVKTWAVGGGVSANKRLRQLMRQRARKCGAHVSFPAYQYLCGDNAAMIGAAASMMARRGEYVTDIDALDRVPRARLG